MKRTKSGARHAEPQLDTQSLQLIEPDAAAIDVGSRSHWVAVNPNRSQRGVAATKGKRGPRNPG